jgi:hypothetical protein
VNTEPERMCKCPDSPGCAHHSVAEQRLAEAIFGDRSPTEAEVRDLVAALPPELRAELLDTIDDDDPPTLDDLLADVTADERDRVLASIYVVERSGGREHEIGADDAGRWWASAHFRGARIMVDGYADAANAADALVRRLLRRAACKCGRAVTLAPKPKACLWRREGARWVAGCTAPPIHVDGQRGDLGAMLAAFNRRHTERPEVVEVPVATADRRRRRRGNRR